jgi:DNA-binding MarR family transcriptional regulator
MARRPPQPLPDAKVRGIAAEINKKKPFDLPEQEAWLTLIRTVSFLSEPIEKVFRDLNLSESSYNALRILRGSGHAGRACNEIGRDMVTRVPDVTRLVDRLEKQGLVTRTREVEDRRVVTVRITDKGLSLLTRLDEPLRDLHKHQFAALNRAEISELTRLLEKIRSRCPKNADPH